MMWLGSLDKPEVRATPAVSDQPAIGAEASEPRMAQGQNGLSIDPPLDGSLTMTVVAFSQPRDVSRGPAAIDEGRGPTYLEVIVEAP